VYLHKTVLSAESLLVNILKRGKELALKGEILFATPPLSTFLRNDYAEKDFQKDPRLLEDFLRLDDNDVVASIKVWSDHKDKILSRLCLNLLNRKLYRVEMQNEKINKGYVDELIEKASRLYNISESEAPYFVFSDTVNNSAYNANQFKINILTSKKELVDVAEASDQLNLQSLSTVVTKYYICYPKELMQQ
jgi:HD superfamily phosphohydrolase